MSPKLNANKLGRAGESKFALLCDQSDLTCNKSNPDETGWDFIVEFPMIEPDLNLTLDKRQPAACHIQLKSTATGRGSRVSLHLSAIERLAKDARPALIVVFLLHPNGDAVAGYVIHLLGEELARVLKQLRVAHQNGSFDLNHASITFDYRKKGRLFEVTPEGLRDALSHACGTDPARYVVEKQRQLEELGYENGRLETEALIWAEGPNHLNSMLLGLAPVKPLKLKIFDTRFGIRVPYSCPQLAQVEELFVQPPSIGACQVLIRGPALSIPATFSAEAYIGPPIPEIDGPQVLIRHGDFAIRLTTERLEFETLGNFDVAKRPLARWIDLVRALSYLSGAHGTISIQGLQRIPCLTLSAERPIDGPNVGRLPQLLRFLDGWERLLSMAGVKSSADFGVEDIWTASAAISTVDSLVYSARDSYFEFQNLSNELTDPEVVALYFNEAKLADAAISYSARVTLRRTNDPLWRYRSTTIEALDVRPLVNDLEAYGMGQAESNALRIVINPRNLTFNPIDAVTPAIAEKRES